MNNSSSVMKFHLTLMILMMCGTVGGAVNFIVGVTNSVTDKERLSNITNIVLMGFILSMLACGAVYLLKGYNKQAAPFYKAFLLLHVGVCALSVVVDLCFYKVTALMICISVLTAVKGIDLLILTFAKDLGKQNTWKLFYVILSIDVIALVLAVINMINVGFDFSFTGYVTALIADGTIGLAVNGKYKNKESRGSK
ncbi:MAG: hypothetical protein IJ696_03040 [Ruminococcus sp.]|nr:hypothetical protein [Ruminococcus sp.]